MRHNHVLKNKKGFTIVELGIALIVIAIILAAVVPAIKTISDNSRITNAVASVKAIQTAATSYYQANGGTYTGITFAVLASGGHLPSQFSATGTNPWTGNYTIAVNGADTTKFDLSLTNVPANAATNLTTQLTKFSEAAPTYTAATKTWQTTLS